MEGRHYILRTWIGLVYFLNNLFITLFRTHCSTGILCPQPACGISRTKFVFAALGRRASEAATPRAFAGPLPRGWSNPILKRHGP